jgi:hypothetical protein
MVNGLKRRANTTYSDEGKRGLPPLRHNFAGRSREASAFPSVVTKAVGGQIVQVHAGKLGFVEEK